MLSFRDSALCVLLTLSTLATSDLFASNDRDLPTACEAPQILHVNDTTRDTGGSVGERRCYRLDLDRQGFLHLELSDAASVYSLDTTGTRLEVFAASSVTLGRTATEQLLQVDSGTLFVTAQATDPRQPLPQFRLTSRWVEATKGEHDDELEIDPEKGEHDDELEIDPEKGEHDDELEIDPEKLSSIASPFGCGSFGKGEHDDELEIDPEKGEHDDELEIDPEKSEHDDELEIDPEKSGCQALRPVIDRLCAIPALEGDDLGDSLACASALDRRAQGTLENGWGDDVDVFRFETDRWQTVEITLRGEVAVRGTLIDDRGQELGTTSEDGRIARQVRTLAPGTYFLRIEGEGSEGRYQVAIVLD